MTNAASGYDPSLSLTQSVPFVYGERPKNQWRPLPGPGKPAQGENPVNYQDHELILADLGGGLNKVWGEIFPHYLGVDLGHSNRTSAANAVDVSFPGQAILSLFMDSENIWPGDNAGFNYSYSTIFMPGYGNRMFVGVGSSANNAIFYESASTPGLTAMTYSPAGAIVSMSSLVFDSLPPKLTVGMINVAAQTIASDLTTFVSMNSTATLWGGIVSPLNASSPGVPTNLLYLQTTASSLTSAITTISGSSAASAVSVDTGTRFNSGGYAVGIANVAVTPGNLVPRAVWVVPQVGNASTMMSAAPLQNPADIMHTNLYGTDPQKLLTDLPFVFWCIVHNGVLFYTDGKRIMMNDGKETDLGWNFEREQDSDYLWFAGGLGFEQGNLIVQACHLNLTTAANSTVQLEKFDAELKVWEPISKVVTPGFANTGSFVGPNTIDRQVVAYPIGATPFSPKTGVHYLLPASDNTHKRDYWMYVAPPGYSHFWNYRYTTGSTHAGFKMEASGTWDSPALSMPWPLKGLPTVITGIGIYGDARAGGTGSATDATQAFIKVQQATQGSGGTYSYTNNISHTVYARDSLHAKARWRDFRPSQYDPFNRLKIRITLNQDATRTDWTPNALPIVIRMRTFLDGVLPNS